MKDTLGIKVVLALVLLTGSACASGGASDLGAVPPSTSGVTSTPTGRSRPPAPCPAHLPSSVENAGATGLADRLVPITATGVRVCRYAPLRAKNANALVRSGVVTTRAAVRNLETETNALHHISNAERIPCPLNPSTPGWAIEFGSGGQAIALVVSASDCGFATNGVISAGPTTSWLDTLARIASRP
jgi:hypothetical protein